MKKTKRKAFNFFRSYFDVYNELETDKDKVAFMDALLNRQFLGIVPENLKGMAKFAYISQVNSIDSQVKGYEDKTGIKLTPTEGGSVGGVKGGSVGPCQQVQDKEKVQDVINWAKLVETYNSLTGKKSRVVNEKVKRKFRARLKEGYTKDDIATAMFNISKTPYHIENNFADFTLEFVSRSDKLEKYSTLKPKQ